MILLAMLCALGIGIGVGYELGDRWRSEHPLDPAALPARDRHPSSRALPRRWE